MLSQKWLSSVENVCIKFLYYLIDGIQLDHYDPALEYFANPKQTITDWFKNQINYYCYPDGHLNVNGVVKQEAAKIYNSEITKLYNTFRRFFMIFPDI